MYIIRDIYLLIKVLPPNTYILILLVYMKLLIIINISINLLILSSCNINKLNKIDNKLNTTKKQLDMIESLMNNKQ